MDVNDPLWGRLGFDEIEQVLARLPLADLCRFRAVCPQWNDLICSPHFAALHAQNHANPQDEDFIVMHYLGFRYPSERVRPISGWCALDLTARRWKTFKDVNPALFLHEVWHEVVAMDGGLVARFSARGSLGNTLLVHSPIGIATRRLPAAPDFDIGHGCPALSFMKDSVTQSFKVVMINRTRRRTLHGPLPSQQERAGIRDDPLVRVFDSVSNAWGSLINPDWDTTLNLTHRCCVSLRSRLFLLFRLGRRRPPFERFGLWSYNLVNEEWSSLVLEDIRESYDLPKLVVTADRLFLVGWSFDHPLLLHMDQRLHLEVQEIDSVDLERNDRVLIMSEVEVMQTFGVRPGRTRFPEIEVIGLRNSRLLLMSKLSGRCRLFDLVTNQWHNLPDNPLRPPPGVGVYMWTGKNMKLLLAGAPWSQPAAAE